MTQEHPRSDQIRVLRIITRLNIGGPAIQAISLSRRLPSEGFPTTLVHGRLGLGEGDMQTLLSADGLDAVSMPALGRNVDPLKDARAFWQMLRLLRRLRPAIVHTHMAKAGAIGRLATIVYNALWARSNRAKLVHTYHGHVLEGYFSPPKTAVFLAAERLLALGTDALLAVSPRIRHELLEDYRIGQPNRFHVVPLGFDLDGLAAIDDEERRRAREELAIPATAKVIAWVGRLTAIKQPEVLLQAARLITQRFPQAIFLVVGDGELRGQAEATAQRLEVANHMRFLGWRGDLARIYGGSDMLMLTSRNEGTPVALIEAMAAGLPSVSPDVGGIRDVVTDPSLGTVVPEATPESLAAAACTLLDAPDRCRQIGGSARPSAVDRFGFARLAANITGLYRGLLDSPTADRRQALTDSSHRAPWARSTGGVRGPVSPGPPAPPSKRPGPSA